MILSLVKDKHAKNTLIPLQTTYIRCKKRKLNIQISKTKSMALVEGFVVSLSAIDWSPPVRNSVKITGRLIGLMCIGLVMICINVLHVAVYFTLHLDVFKAASVMMASWHETAFHVTGLLYGESTGRPFSAKILYEPMLIQAHNVDSSPSEQTSVKQHQNATIFIQQAEFKNAVFKMIPINLPVPYHKNIQLSLHTAHHIHHFNDIILNAMASQITNLTIV